jgi:hypothetical protein
MMSVQFAQNNSYRQIEAQESIFLFFSFSDFNVLLMTIFPECKKDSIISKWVKMHEKEE